MLHTNIVVVLTIDVLIILNVLIYRRRITAAVLTERVGAMSAKLRIPP
jgi:hypothetical protein